MVYCLTTVVSLLKNGFIFDVFFIVLWWRQYDSQENWEHRSCEWLDLILLKQNNMFLP